jgi:hypothetical protein
MAKDRSKITYSSPQLIEYGSVRNLTGGSGIGMMDAGSGMIMV